jgi:hypothetical protein
VRERERERGRETKKRIEIGEPITADPGLVQGMTNQARHVTKGGAVFCRIGLALIGWCTLVNCNIADSEKVGESTAALSADWVRCASEGETCSFTGSRRVAYGTNDVNVMRTFTTSAPCNNGVFGDPVPGTIKGCWYERAAPDCTTTTTWRACANEGERCAFAGARRVRYGTEATNTVMTFTDGTQCTNGVFGDPIVGVRKSCWFEETAPGSCAPPPAPTPTPTPTPQPTPPSSGGSNPWPQPPMPGMPVVNAPLHQVINGGVSTMQIIEPSPEAVSPAAGGGEFRTSCRPSHMSFDDPLVYFGQRGRSHHHTFFGNTAVDASVNLDNLRNVGNSTCDGGTANKTAYWVPSMIDTRTGTPKVPVQMNIYYKHGYDLPDSEFRKIEAPPQGLRILIGYPMRTTEWPEFSHEFHCELPNGTHTNSNSSTIPNCPVGSKVSAAVWAPQCWDGRLDSSDHKSHLTWGFGRACPASHPRAIPQITEIITYEVQPGDDPSRWKYSSDMTPDGQPGGLSLHADWINGWDPAILNTWITRCIHAADCHANNLGDGRRLN